METVPLSLLYTYIERESELWSGNGLPSRKRAVLLEASLSERDLVSGQNWGKHIFGTRESSKGKSNTFFPPLIFQCSLRNLIY